ncbi:hypothetical protein NFJ02_01g40280 [Pycnococcus provasolii]
MNHTDFYLSSNSISGSPRSRYRTTTGAVSSSSSSSFEVTEVAKDVPDTSHTNPSSSRGPPSSLASPPPSESDASDALGPTPPAGGRYTC